MNMIDSRKIAVEFMQKAENLGWSVFVDHEVIRGIKYFEPGNLQEYTKADTEWYGFMSMIPRTRPGSTWGSTSDGIGGYVGHKNGKYEINMSGANKHVINAIKKERERIITSMPF